MDDSLAPMCHIAEYSATGLRQRPGSQQRSGRREGSQQLGKEKCPGLLNPEFSLSLSRKLFDKAILFVAFALVVVAFPRLTFGQFTDLPTIESKPAATKPATAPSKTSASKKTGTVVAAPRGIQPQTATPTVRRPRETKETLAPSRSTSFQTKKKSRSPSDSKPASPAVKIEKFEDIFQVPHGQQDAVNPARPSTRANHRSGSSTPSHIQGSGDRTGNRSYLDFNNERPVQTDDKRNWRPRVAERTTQPMGMIRKVQRQKQSDVYEPWWQQQLTRKALGKNQNLTHKISVDQLVMAMLQYSPEIRALQQEPMIASTYVDVENAKFDPVTFLESKWEDTNEPVGNILTTNNSPFLKDHIVTSKGGFRKRSQIGTELELSQNLGFKNSNSEFFLPQDQGTARIVMNIDQPLLNGAGRMVGTSRVVLAQIDTGISESQYAEKLQEKILAVISAYWEFYYQKSVLILRKQNYDAAVEILRLLKGRESFDAQRSQIIRAEAAVAARKLDLIRSRTDVRNAETVLRELTRDPRLGKLGIANPVELIPTEFPQVDDSIYPSLPAVVTVAFHNRPEIDQAMQKLRAASVQHDVSKNQLLPQLNFIFNMYSAALNGETSILKAWNRQFTDSTPGYSAGIVLEYPIYNRAALARKRRVEAQLTKLSSELDDTLGSISAEVEIAHRELKLSLEATAESRRSVEAAQKDEAFIQKRWKNFAFLQNPEFASPTIFLEQLLDAQDRIAQAQAQYANATRQFMVAVAELRKAEGSLLNYETIAPSQMTAPGETNLPEMLPQSDINQFR